jgi:hypothetical protein
MPRQFLALGTLAIAAVIPACLGLNACSSPGFGHEVKIERYLSPAIPVILPVKSAGYLGLSVPGRRPRLALARRLAGSAGFWPNLLYFPSEWHDAFPAAAADAAVTHGTIPIIEFTPSPRLLARIAAGRYDSYLDSYATAVRRFGRPVIMGLAPSPEQMAGNHANPPAAPSIWISAWRHLVRVFSTREATNVTWQWTFVATGQDRNARMYWPGGAYVGWVAVESSFTASPASQTGAVNSAITKVRAITRKPVLLSVDRINVAIRNIGWTSAILADLRHRHLIGLVVSSRDTRALTEAYGLIVERFARTALARPVYRSSR